jgi:hypothetical protein
MTLVAVQRRTGAYWWSMMLYRAVDAKVIE